MGTAARFRLTELVTAAVGGAQSVQLQHIAGPLSDADAAEAYRLLDAARDAIETTRREVGRR